MTITIEPLETTDENEGRYYTLEEFYAWLKRNADDVQYELINGVIVEKDKSDSAGPSGRYGEIMSKLSFYLSAHILPNNLGRVFTDAPFQFKDDTGADAGNQKKRKSNYLIPDVGFVKTGRVPDVFNGPVPTIPDLVAEINSPSDTLERIGDKVEIYKRSGVGLIWSIFMADRYVVVHHAGSDDIILLNREDELDGENVLPGFKLKLNALFK